MDTDSGGDTHLCCILDHWHSHLHDCISRAVCVCHSNHFAFCCAEAERTHAEDRQRCALTREQQYTATHQCI